MKEAYNHHRVTPEGQALGKPMATIADRMCLQLAEDQGIPDTRCKTCAFRAGTVPNGCPQTQMDAYKAVVESVPFGCHQVKGTTCHGWRAANVLAVRAELDGKPFPPAPYDFSPPDEVSP